MRHILPEELLMLSRFLPAAKAKAPGETAPTRMPVIPGFQSLSQFHKHAGLSHCAERKLLHTDSTDDFMKKL